MTLDNFGTWLEIDLSVLRNNFKLLSKLTGAAVMPIVKANAYGHGLERVAEAMEKSGAEWFGVARVEEALALRDAGIKANILVLGYTPPIRVSHAIKENISLTVYDLYVAEMFARQANGLKKAVNLHVKIDTGMGRLGILPEQAVNFIEYIQRQQYLNLEGVFTHFACADEPKKNVTDAQIECFEKVLEDLKSKGLLPPIIHAANSAGAINYPNTRFNLIRSGIALYGHSPSADTILPEGIASAITWKTRLISIKELPKGHGVSYGHKYHTHDKERIGVIAVGYADGLRRRPGNHVLIHGKIVPIIGNVCMDQCMVNLDQFPEAEIGDEVVIIGKQDGEEISATKIADDWGTINYEVLCGLAARMPRYYFNSLKNHNASV
ncbi:MAG: alanine racemase [Anaerolineaceae bacterium]|nr:alanine racemase [Anaerolineaceae bacterium]